MINGIVAAPVLSTMMWLAATPRVMGELMIELPLKLGGWIAVAITATSVIPHLSDLGSSANAAFLSRPMTG